MRLFPNQSKVLLSLILAVSFFGGTAIAADDEPPPETNKTDEHLPDYLIIGAGGSGLQTALFLEKHKHSYVILEKNFRVGSFWAKFPRFRELISVNKWVRNETQKMRYDWHSMLEAPLTMGEVSEDYFPKGGDWKVYMEKVAKQANLNIEFGIKVTDLATDETPCVTIQDGTQRCAKYRVFVGTGLRERSQPYLEALGGYPYSKASKELAYHRRVCILGNGNSAFEISQNVMGVSDRVTMYGRHPHRFSAITRYTGDVRVKFGQVLENFNGKLLDTVDHFERRPEVKVPKSWGVSDDRMAILKDALEAAAFLNQHECEVLFYATGFESYVPGLDLSKSRFPATDDWYAWKQNPKIHFIGWLMHERDFRKGAGGFLSGYRYLIRNLIHHVRQVDFDVPYPYKTLPGKQAAIRHALVRVQVADDLIILQDGVVIKDVLIKSTGTNGETEYRYYEGISYKFHKDLTSQPFLEEVVSLYFAWGDGKRASTVFEDVIRYTDTQLLLNYLLHPVIEVPGNLTRNIQEDTEMAWTGPSFQSAVVRVVDEALSKNYTVFQTKKTFPYKRAEKHMKEDVPRDYESCGVLPEIDKLVVNAIMTAIRFDDNPEAMKNISIATSQWLPHMIGFEGILKRTANDDGIACAAN